MSLKVFRCCWDIQLLTCVVVTSTNDCLRTLLFSRFLKGNTERVETPQEKVVIYFLSLGFPPLLRLPNVLLFGFFVISGHNHSKKGSLFPNPSILVGVF
jgi:hypothetical protein